MEQARARRTGTLAFRILSPVGLLAAVAGLLVWGFGGTASGQTRAGGATPPPDGKYENVTVEGRKVAMVHVMEGGAVVLVDVDGQKPRTWEEQFKRKGNLPNGTYDVHKTNVTGDESFANERIDRLGIWTIDDKGNLLSH